MIDIDKLLKKKRLTGKELGQLELVNVLDIFSRTERDEENPVPIINREQFVELYESTITNSKEKNDYKAYIAIHEWLSRIRVQAGGFEQQAFLNCNILLNAITNANLVEDIYQCLDNNTRNMNEGDKSNLYTNMKTYTFVFSLDSFLPECEDFTENLSYLENARGLLNNSYNFIHGYNVALDIIAKIFNLEEVMVAAVNLEFLNSFIEEFNDIAKELYEKIKHNYKTDNEQTEKLNVMDKVFYPISIDNLKITEEKISSVKAEMEKGKITKFGRYVM